jgi:hypothetical protein
MDGAKVLQSMCVEMNMERILAIELLISQTRAWIAGLRLQYVTGFEWTFCTMYGRLQWHNVK